MITDAEKAIIEDCARKYDVRRVILFGSAVEREDARDIDLGVEGIEAGLLFKFIGDLIRLLPRPVDVVDLSISTRFGQLISGESVPIYG